MSRMGDYMRKQQNVYDEITTRILAQLERGVVPWLMPWSERAAADISGTIDGVPINRVSARAYSGINTLMLWCAAIEQAWPQPWQFVTYKQAAELGGHVREGEKATPVFYLGEAKNKHFIEPMPGEQSSQRPTYRFLKKYWVFHWSQCEGIQPRKIPERDTRIMGEAAFTAFVANTGADIRIGGTSAHYDRRADFVAMPPLGAFIAKSGEAEGPEHYKATVCHELVHWSGAPHRLARDKARSYAFEELVAEIGSAFLGAELGTTPELRHAEYIGHWIRGMKDDATAIVRAAAQASKAAEYLLSLKAPPIAINRALVPYDRRRTALVPIYPCLSLAA
jgi:antirestriction protein ArdC